MGVKFEPYDGKQDAERLLEGPLFRKNWTVDTRDEIAKSLELIVLRERQIK